MPRRMRALQRAAIGAIAVMLSAFAAPAKAETIIVLSTNVDSLQPPREFAMDEQLSLSSGEYVDLLMPDLTTARIVGATSGEVRNLPRGGERFSRVYEEVKENVYGELSKSTAAGAARSGRLIAIDGWPFSYGGSRTAPAVFCSTGGRPRLTLPASSRSATRAMIEARGSGQRSPESGMSMVDARSGLEWPETPTEGARYQITTSQGVISLVVRSVSRDDFRPGPGRFMRLFNLGCVEQAFASLDR